MTRESVSVIKIVFVREREVFASSVRDGTLLEQLLSVRRKENNSKYPPVRLKGICNFGVRVLNRTLKDSMTSRQQFMQMLSTTNITHPSQYQPNADVNVPLPQQYPVS